MAGKIPASLELKDQGAQRDAHSFAGTRPPNTSPHPLQFHHFSSWRLTDGEIADEPGRCAVLWRSSKVHIRTSDAIFKYYSKKTQSREGFDYEAKQA